MKKIIALLLTCALLLGLASAHAEGTEKYDRLTVGVTTPFTGNFLDDVLGSNLADQDVRMLIHGYSLVEWDQEKGSYEFSRPQVTTATASSDNLTYTFAITDDMKYNDGTPITARDYAFTLLLLGSPELKEAAGARGDISRIKGGSDYQNGTAKELAGFKLVGDYEFAITIDSAYYPYFYQLKVLDVSPLPIDVIAPGCTIQKSGNGVKINGPFSADLLKKTLLDPETGYISHPSVTSGPYQLTAYDGESVTLDLNKNFLGDEEGEKPEIPQIVIKTTDPDSLINDLNTGALDLAVRCVRADQIANGMAMVGDDFKMESYMRAGLSFISFCAEKGPTSDVNVRKALAMCMDKEALTRAYNGGFGMTVNGYYGIGQWMFRMANGAILQDEEDESDWSDLTISRITGYDLDVEGAGELLNAAGWNLDQNGGAYSTGVRYRKEGDALVPLELKLIYPEENGAGPLLQETFIDNLAQAGVKLDIEPMPWEDLLQRYYRQTERDCDMILLGTNFGEVFDPSGEYDEDGTSVRNGITDPALRELAITMRSTEPGEAAEYCRRWLAYLEERTAVAAEIPIYSDAYLDFHISALQHYNASPTGQWAMAVQTAILSDYVPEEETEEAAEELGDDLEEESLGDEDELFD